MTEQRTLPPDEPARIRIRASLEETLFVEAGAGSGKTTALVERIVASVKSGIAITEIAAITFTEKAASELRHRIREELGRAAAVNDRDGRACAQALEELDRAALGTLHSFAQRILSEFPIEAGLPPRIEVLDEIGSQLMFEERWRDDLDALLRQADTDPELADVLLFSRAANIRRREFRQLMVALGREIDLVETWLPPHAPVVPALEVDDIVRSIRELLNDCRATIESQPEDKLVQHLLSLLPLADNLARADAYHRFVLLHDAKFTCRFGTAKAWGGADGKQAVVDALHDLQDRAADRTKAILHACLKHLAIVFGRMSLAAAQARKREGKLEFHDLLVHARGLLRHPEFGHVVRGHLHQRWKRLLLDEFQDTDPIQLELASLITTNPDLVDADWQDLPPQPGHLFVVGDPKQSIYRFRRADIGLFLAAREALTDDVVQLTTNFRTTAPIIEWINVVFGRLIQEKAGAQAAFVPLHSPREGSPDGPHVLTLGHQHDAGTADDIRVAEAADIAAVIATATTWTVNDNGLWRTARFNDMAILLPTRISLPALEDALTSADIPYRAESSALVYATREIRDLLMAARCLDDPSDSLSLVAALRNPLFGCSDLDLAVWRQRGGRFGLLNSRHPERLQDADPVYDAVVYLRQLHDERHWLSPAQLLERLANDRRMFDVALLGSRSSDVWRRLRFLLDQARAWSGAGGRGLRSFLGWCALQGREGTYASDAALSENDDNAVRIMTVHAAKGLEFPITIVAGLATKRGTERQGVSVRWHHGTPQIGVRKDVSTSDYDEARELDDQMDHEERLRLLYVACTRARDHLVVSLHRKAPPKKGYTTEVSPSATLIAEARTDAPNEVLWADDMATASTPERPFALPDAAPVPFARNTWLSERSALFARALEPSTISPSRLAGFASDEDEQPGLLKDARPLDLPPWNRGRYGTAIGRAVHGVLQSIELSSDRDVDATSAAQAAAEGVLGKESVIAELVRSALQSPTVKQAAVLPHWREMFVGTKIGDRVLEGYIDLLYKTAEGYVVVDYKTDVVDDATIDDRVEHYRLQGAGYAVAVEAIVQEPVIDCRFVFCRPGEAVERSLPNLTEAMAEVRRRLSGERIAEPSDAQSTTASASE
jgi:ATP-dependent helicase/nuclease subunit A